MGPRRPGAHAGDRLNDRAQPRVVVLALGGASLGEGRRVESWRSIFDAAGADVGIVELLSYRRAQLRSGPGVLGRTVPERLAWSDISLRRHLTRLEPQVVVAVTTRAFSAAVAAGAPRVVLDFVDASSIPTRDRVRLEVRMRASARRRADVGTPDAAAAPGNTIVRTAAGWADAESLSAEWVPNVTALAPGHTPVAPTHDVLFVGSLEYPPNVEAVERLADAWPYVLTHRPKATALIAGRRPTPRVTELVERRGWTLMPDFDDIASVTPEARIAVAPLARTSGIQNKVLEAAALGLPQVVTPQALAGLRPGFPAEVASREDDLGPRIVELLADTARQAELRAAGIEEIRRTYVADAWAGW
ncbi:MAG: glycosyltransferase, partial [Actinobacteria bacterium]|nr:glycosyltransferase [Actinomycetota bacterium]